MNLKSALPVLVPAFLMLGACGDARRTETAAAAGADIAHVRYISTMKAHTATDLYFGDTRIASSTASTEPGPYQTVPAERRNFTLRAAGVPDNLKIDSNSEGLNRHGYYTVVAYEDSDGKPGLKIVRDDVDAPAAGKAKVRLINAAPGTDEVKLFHSGKAKELADNADFGEASDWREVDVASGNLEIRSEGRTKASAAIPNLKMEAGKLYTFVVESTGQSGRPLNVVPLIDSPTKS